MTIRSTYIAVRIDDPRYINNDIIFYVQWYNTYKYSGCAPCQRPAAKYGKITQDDHYTWSKRERKVVGKWRLETFSLFLRFHWSVEEKELFVKIICSTAYKTRFVTLVSKYVHYLFFWRSAWDLQVKSSPECILFKIAFKHIDQEYIYSFLLYL